MADLIEQLRKRIKEQGPLSFRDYMEEVLRSYYASPRNPIGMEDGDYYTSGDLDPIFGKLLARQFAQWAAEFDSFSILELGAGKGLLARDVLQHHKFPYFILERSPAMRARQEELLHGYEVAWIQDLPSRFTGCIFSNEFFDALPVHRVVRRNGVLKEIFVDEEFHEIELELGHSPPQLRRGGAPKGEPDRAKHEEKPRGGVVQENDFIDQHHPSLGFASALPSSSEEGSFCAIQFNLPPLQEGQCTEINVEAKNWIRQIATSLHRGYHLVIDYGYLADEFYTQPRGTLMCYWKHQAVEDPYARIGEQDITAHVNFSDLMDVGVESGLETIRLTRQMDYLISLGILEEIEKLATVGDASSMQRLVKIKKLILPDSMGQRFKVLVQTKRGVGGPANGHQ